MEVSGQLYSNANVNAFKLYCVVQVRERRHLRDEKQQQRTESRLLLKQAQREAEEEVKREEREARGKAKQEEKLIDLQVTLIRSQLREQQKASRELALKQRSAIEKEARQSSGRRKWGLKDVLGTSPVVLKAEKIVMSEKRRQRTRSELMKQLEEARAHETKENIKLLHHCFSAWYETVVVRRAKLGKVVAVREWRAMVRAWGGWRRFVKERKTKRERDMTTREMQKIRRYLDACTMLNVVHSRKDIVFISKVQWKLTYPRPIIHVLCNKIESPCVTENDTIQVNNVVVHDNGQFFC